MSFITPTAQKVNVKSSINHIIDKTYDLIEKNNSNRKFSIEILSYNMNLSRYQLYRKVNSITVKSISELIRIYKLEKTAEIIRREYSTISKTCYFIGFSELASFSNKFKKHFDVSPTKNDEMYFSQ